MQDVSSTIDSGIDTSSFEGSLLAQTFDQPSEQFAVGPVHTTIYELPYAFEGRPYNGMGLLSRPGLGDNYQHRASVPELQPSKTTCAPLVLGYNYRAPVHKTTLELVVRLRPNTELTRIGDEVPK